MHEGELHSSINLGSLEVRDRRQASVPKYSTNVPVNVRSTPCGAEHADRVGRLPLGDCLLIVLDQSSSGFRIRSLPLSLAREHTHQGLAQRPVQSSMKQPRNRSLRTSLRICPPPKYLYRTAGNNTASSPKSTNLWLSATSSKPASHPGHHATLATIKNQGRSRIAGADIRPSTTASPPPASSLRPSAPFRSCDTPQTRQD